jgi:hypothetical protein
VDSILKQKHQIGNKPIQVHLAHAYEPKPSSVNQTPAANPDKVTHEEVFVFKITKTTFRNLKKSESKAKCLKNPSQKIYFLNPINIFLKSKND